MLAIGSAAGAASFTHVHNVAAVHGQPGWLAWADAIVLELMSIASGLELRRRQRAATSVTFPATVLGCAVTLSLAAQVYEAEPTPVGWMAAAVPALGFLVMVKVALGHTSAKQAPERHTSDPTTDRSSATADGIALRANPDPALVVGTASSGAKPDGDRRAGPVRSPARGRSRGRSARPDRDDVRALLPAARTVRDQLTADELALTRGALAHRLRTAGHSVSNTRASALLKVLKAEQVPPPPGT